MWQAQKRVAGVCGQGRFAAQVVLGRVDGGGGGAELFCHDDAMPLKVHVLPSQRVKLAGTQAGKRGDLQPGRERWAGERRARPGFDCSGLLLYAAYQASDGKVRLLHYAGDQIDEAEAAAGSRPLDLSWKEVGSVLVRLVRAP